MHAKEGCRHHKPDIHGLFERHVQMRAKMGHTIAKKEDVAVPMQMQAAEHVAMGAGKNHSSLLHKA
jgi:hypothetical protein